MEKIKKENKNKVVNYICPIFRFATQPFNGGYIYTWFFENWSTKTCQSSSLALIGNLMALVN